MPTPRPEKWKRRVEPLITMLLCLLSSMVMYILQLTGLLLRSGRIKNVSFWVLSCNLITDTWENFEKNTLFAIPKECTSQWQAPPLGSFEIDIFAKLKNWFFPGFSRFICVETLETIEKWPKCVRFQTTRTTRITNLLNYNGFRHLMFSYNLDPKTTIYFINFLKIWALCDFVSH